MILLDTHIWVWWANESPSLKPSLRTEIEKHFNEGLGVSVISCWEVGMLVDKGRRELKIPSSEWIDSALELPGVVSIPLTPQIAIASSFLPPPIHGDPADRILVATARSITIPLLTADRRLIEYPHVTTL